MKKQNKDHLQGSNCTSYDLIDVLNVLLCANAIRFYNWIWHDETKY